MKGGGPAYIKEKNTQLPAILKSHSYIILFFLYLEVYSVNNKEFFNFAKNFLIFASRSDRLMSSNKSSGFRGKSQKILGKNKKFFVIANTTKCFFLEICVIFFFAHDKARHDT